MEIAPLIVIIVVFLLPLLLLLLQAITSRNSPSLRLPPRPRELPIIGSLHRLGRLPHRSLHRLSEAHGPLQYLKVGSVPTVVASSPATATQVLKTHDLSFCNRADLPASRLFTYGFADVAFAPHGETWRTLRSILVQEMLSPRKILASRAVRQEELALILASLERLAGAKPVEVRSMALSFSNNVACRLAFGRTDKEEESLKSRFRELVEEITVLMAGTSLEDAFPSLWLISVVTGRRSALLRVFRRLDRFLEDEILKATAKLEEEEEEEAACFVRTLLRLQRSSGSLSRDNVKALIFDVFLGTSDTFSVTMEWAVAELMRNHRVMARVQAEVRAIIPAGQKPRVSESDIEHLPYLKKVIMETLRLHPPNVLSFPRESLQDRELLGYHIPARTRVVLNVWAINRDPEHWKEPERFWPERPEWEEVDYMRHGFCFLPFGAGRRMCPGIPMAVPTMELTLANLLRCFDWELPEDETLDLEEKFAFSTRKKNPLLLKLIPIVP